MSDPGHDHPQGLLSPYLDGELRAAERDRVEAHLERCAACGAELDALRRLASAIRAEAVPPVPEGLNDRIARRLDAATVVPFRKRLAIPATIAATIGAVGLVLVVAWRGERTDMGRPAAPERKDLPESHADAPRDEAPAAPAPPPPPPRRQAEADPKAKPDRAQVEAMKPAEPSPAPRNEPDEGGGVAGGVVGGVVGGVEEGATEGDEAVAQKEKEERQANDELTRKVSTTMAAPASLAAARESLASVCGTDVADAPAHASWVVRDRAAATRQLAALAAGHGGALQQPDRSAPGLVVLVVPTSRYDAFAAAARAVGVQIDAAPVPPGGTCVRQRIELRPPPAD